MPAPERRRHPALARRDASLPRVSGARQKAAGGKVTAARSSADGHRRAIIDRELVELDAECARVRRLLQRLAVARRTGRDAGAILGELGTSVLHLHVHTKGLDTLIDEIG